MITIFFCQATFLCFSKNCLPHLQGTSRLRVRLSTLQGFQLGYGVKWQRISSLYKKVVKVMVPVRCPTLFFLLENHPCEFLKVGKCKSYKYICIQNINIHKDHIHDVDLHKFIMSYSIHHVDRGYGTAQQNHTIYSSSRFILTRTLGNKHMTKIL